MDLVLPFMIGFAAQRRSINDIIPHFAAIATLRGVIYLVKMCEGHLCRGRTYVRPATSVNDRLFYARAGHARPYKTTEEIYYAFNRRTRQIIRHRLAAVFAQGGQSRILRN